MTTRKTVASLVIPLLLFAFASLAMLIVPSVAGGAELPVVVAQRGIGQWGIVQWVIAGIVIAGVIGIAYAACRHFGVVIPPVFITIFWIVVVCVFAIVAIKILVGFM